MSSGRIPICIGVLGQPSRIGSRTARACEGRERQHQGPARQVASEAIVVQSVIAPDPTVP